jgi:hypothetical protein
MIDDKIFIANKDLAISLVAMVSIKILGADDILQPSLCMTFGPVPKSSPISKSIPVFI